jgi:hypothetical protein
MTERLHGTLSVLWECAVMLKRLVSLGAAAFAALTAACEDGPASVSGTWRSPATWSTMIYASSDGPLLVEVLGHPFAGQAAGDLAVRVAAAMSGQLIGRPLTFTASPAQAPRPQYRVVVAFNLPVATDPKALCGGKVSPGPAADKVRVLASFCDDGQMLASVQGWVGKADGADDPRFRRLLGQMTRDLFGSPS